MTRNLRFAIDLQTVFQAGVDRVRGDRVVRSFLATDRRDWRGVHLVAIGKAAAAMTEGALSVMGERVAAGLAITKHGYGATSRGVLLKPHAAPTVSGGRIRLLETGHPLPDQASLDAGEALISFLDQAPREAPLLFLISGGASSLVERLPPGGSLLDLQRVNDWLLASGWDIHQMNRIRKGLSLIKGGRLARSLAGRRTTLLLISDVRDDDPSVIGSGLLVPDHRPNPDEAPDSRLPPWLRSLFVSVPPSPDASDPVFQNIDRHLLANSTQAKTAVADQARALGYQARMAPEFIAGEAADQGERLAKALLESAPGMTIWGGETTVRLPRNPGRGGRCQHLALAAARIFDGCEGVALLAAGTDGSDGPGEWAGAIVDGQTIQRGQTRGFDPEEALRRADSQPFLAAANALHRTGATGTNVMDLIIGVKKGD